MGKLENICLLLILAASACDDDTSRPPPIDRVDCPRSSVQGGSAPGCPVDVPETSSSSDDGSSSDESSTGEPEPTCAGYQACTEGCLEIDASWAFGEEARQECADSCEPPAAFDLAESWGAACAKQDLDTCTDCEATCEDGLAVCLHFEESEQ